MFAGQSPIHSQMKCGLWHKFMDFDPPKSQVKHLHDAGYRCRMTGVEVATCWRSETVERKMQHRATRAAAGGEL